MDKEYLLDYGAKEEEECTKFHKSLDEDFEFNKDRFPPDNRFFKLKHPVAYFKRGGTTGSDIWAQVPFCGSLIVSIPPYNREEFEDVFFRVSDIPEIVNFVKEKGGLQFVLEDLPIEYRGLDFLDPIFKELRPPFYYGLKVEDFIPNARESIHEADKRFRNLNRPYSRFGEEAVGHRIADPDRKMAWFVFIFLKGIQHPIIDYIEKLMISDPLTARAVLLIAGSFIVAPLFDIRCDMTNYSRMQIMTTQFLPDKYRPSKPTFPFEIGKLLYKKLIIAPSNLRSCYEILDHFHSHDLQKLLESLNRGIMLNDPDYINRTAEEISEALDAIWNDKSVCTRISGLKIGLPLSVGVLGSIAGSAFLGPMGAFGGFLAELGFIVADKGVSALFDGQTTGLSERVAKLRLKSYQVNVYDFKKKYAGILPPLVPKENTLDRAR